MTEHLSTPVSESGLALAGRLKSRSVVGAVPALHRGVEHAGARERVDQADAGHEPDDLPETYALRYPPSAPRIAAHNASGTTPA